MMWIKMRVSPQLTAWRLRLMIGIFGDRKSCDASISSDQRALEHLEDAL